MSRLIILMIAHAALGPLLPFLFLFACFGDPERATIGGLGFGETWIALHAAMAPMMLVCAGVYVITSQFFTGVLVRLGLALVAGALVGLLGALFVFGLDDRVARHAVGLLGGFVMLGAAFSAMAAELSAFVCARWHAGNKNRVERLVF